MTDREKIPGTVGMLLPGHSNPEKVPGLNISPSAIALLVPLDHLAMESIPKLLKPGHTVTLSHDSFGNKKAILHRVFRHRNGNSKWIFSFLKNIHYPRDPL